MATSFSKLRDASKPLCKNEHLLRWVKKIVELTKPASIHWVDGSQEEYDVLCQEVVNMRIMARIGMPVYGEIEREARRPLRA